MQRAPASVSSAIVLLRCQDVLRTACKDMHDRMDPAKLVALQRNLAAMSECAKRYFPDGMKLGTACSGTDLIVYVIQVLLEYWREDFAWTSRSSTFRHRKG